MARDRKRAKQRRGTRATRRSAAAADPARGGAGAQARGGAEGSALPGALEHASADADEFEAALVRGAGGLADDSQLPEDSAAGTEVASAPDEPASAWPGAGEHEGDGSADELEEADAGPPGGGDRGRGGGGGEEAGADRAPGAPLKGGNRAVAFLQASWAELQRVQWPDRRQTTQATAVVLGFVVVAGAYLGVADVVAKEIVEFVLG